jgi:hypothetical protein
VAIEVKQLIIKSTLVGEGKQRERAEIARADLDLLKQELIEACKEMVEQSLEEIQER